MNLIVDKISKMVVPVALHVDECLVGMGARVQEMIAKLEMGSDGVRMIGIWGICGIGKTTLAYYLSRVISSFFEGHCALEDISEESNKHGLIPLQKKIISTLLKKEVEFEDVDIGKCIISELSCKNVLLVLDGVDDIEQLDALAGSPHWFGSGSRIIITTRNENLLATHKVDHIHPMGLLSNEEAIQLFNKFAYNEEKPLKDYHTLSLQLLSNFEGIPLNLKILGMVLYHQDEKGWMIFLDRIENEGLKRELKELGSLISSFFWRHMDSLFEIFED